MEQQEAQQIFFDAYERYADELFRFCLFRVSDREIAQDLLQEAFTKTWQYMARGKEVENIRTFLYRVCRNLITDHYRKKQADSLDSLQDAGFDPEDETSQIKIEAGAEIGQMKKLLSKIDNERYVEILIMRYINDLSIPEISEIRNESHNVVSVTLNRATEALKKTIKEYEG